MPPRPLKAGTLPKHHRTAVRPRHLLALAGGGYRGLFTATVLQHMEKASRTQLARRFDMIAGTSIGGILAIGLGCGIGAAKLAKLVRDNGSEIFRAKLTSFGGFTASHYDSAALRGVIETILGKENAARPFAQVPAPLIVVAVNERTGEPRIFRTDLAAPGAGDAIATIDVAMATSAAPTYFSPHVVGDQAFVDGGLIANAPDLVLIAEAMRRYGARLDDIHLCSIGTAGSRRVGRVTGGPGKVGWVVKHKLIELIMDAQAELAADQVDCLRPASVLRIDRPPSRRIDLADTSKSTTVELINLADQAVAEARADQLPAWRRILAHKPTS